MPAPTTEKIGSVLDQDGRPPWDWFSQVQQLGDVVWDHRANAWLVTTYDALRAMSMDDITLWARPEQAVGSPEAGFEALPPGVDPDEWLQLVDRYKVLRGHGGNRTMELTMLGGAEHEHQHRWWMRAMSPRALDKWRDTLVRPLAEEQIDLFVAAGGAELCREFVDPMVPRMIAGIMGEPTDRAWVERHKQLSDDFASPRLSGLHDYIEPDVLERGVAAGEGLRDTLLPIIDAKRDGEGDDVISMIWRDAENFFAPEKYGSYNEHDIVALALNIGRSGVLTVGPGVRNVLYALMSRPELQMQLREEGSEAIRSLGEEALRLYGPVDLRMRVALEDTELRGVEIKSGDTVIGLRLAANRDEARYPSAGKIDLERKTGRDHFSFYKGPRACPGQSLARTIIEETIGVVLERLPNLRLDADAPPPVYTGLILRRWEPLHVLFG